MDPKIDVNAIRPGDTVRLEFPRGHPSGPSTVEGGVQEIQPGGGIAVGPVLIRFSNGNVTGNARYITSHTPAPAPLPTAVGVYLDCQGNVWRIREDGGPLFCGGTVINPTAYAPFTRLLPETDAGRRKPIDRDALTEVISEPRWAGASSKEIADKVIAFLDEGETA